jgi:hypothetical protein
MEETGTERLEMLHEQRERLEFMHEERGLLLEVLEAQKRMMEQSKEPLGLPPPSNEREIHPADEDQQTPAHRWLNWSRRVFGE